MTDSTVNCTFRHCRDCESHSEYTRLIEKYHPRAIWIFFHGSRTVRWICTSYIHFQHLDT